jgi:uncharacterized membrane protein
MRSSAIRVGHRQIAGLAVCLALFAALSSLLDLSPVIRVPLGLLLTLILPGYALSAAVSPEKLLPQGRLDLALILGLSVAVTPLVVMGADWLWTVSNLHATFALAGCEVVFLAIAVFRLRVASPVSK